MLINCPRCGFSQPQDQYCAQCGIDMQAFTPKEEPLFTRLIQSTALQVIVLLLAAVFVGQSILRSEKPQKWVQRISPFSGVSKSTKSTNSFSSDANDEVLAHQNEAEQITTSSSESSELDSLKNRSVSLTRGRDGAPISNDTSTNSTVSAAQDLSSINFKLTYAEVSHENLNKWIAESSNIGLYQSFDSYSAGIVYDFKKFSSSLESNLKTANIKLGLGNTNSNISGSMTDDGSQVIGLITAIEYRSNENDSIHGNISVSKNTRQNNESYPAEFGLPKGAAFFIIGAIKPENFASDRSKLNMPPFQIFKSPDFMTHKTEFVIILEPDYK